MDLWEFEARLENRSPGSPRLSSSPHTCVLILLATPTAYLYLCLLYLATEPQNMQGTLYWFQEAHRGGHHEHAMGHAEWTPQSLFMRHVTRPHDTLGVT